MADCGLRTTRFHGRRQGWILKILCNHTPSAPHFIRSGWGRVFTALGHQFRFWNPEQQGAFDAFDSFNPDIYLGTTYELSRAVVKCIRKRPEMKVGCFASAWGPYLDDIDLKKYPLVVVGEEEKRVVEALKRETDKPDVVFLHAHGRWLDGTMSGWGGIGVPYISLLNACDLYVYLGGKVRPELACDVAFVGGRWPFKAINIDPYILPLCHSSSGLKTKIFGNKPWPVANWMGPISLEDERDLYCSATISPSVSEPHATDVHAGGGWDIVERNYKILGSGGMLVSDYVEEARDLFTEQELPMFKTPAEYHEAVQHFAASPDEAACRSVWGRRAVLMKHTYHHRVADLFDAFGMRDEAARCDVARHRVVEKHGLGYYLKRGSGLSIPPALAVGMDSPGVWP